jgi:hypothetical protein
MEKKKKLAFNEIMMGEEKEAEKNMFQALKLKEEYKQLLVKIYGHYLLIIVEELF